MTIKIKMRDHDYQIEGDLSLNKIYKRLNISAQSVLAIRNGLLLTEDEIIHNDDLVEFIAIISGG
jgi:sulfur carrier protein ThiS